MHTQQRRRKDRSRIWANQPSINRFVYFCSSVVVIVTVTFNVPLLIFFCSHCISSILCVVCIELSCTAIAIDNIVQEDADNQYLCVCFFRSRALLFFVCTAANMLRHDLLIYFRFNLWAVVRSHSTIKSMHISNETIMYLNDSNDGGTIKIGEPTISQCKSQGPKKSSRSETLISGQMNRFVNQTNFDSSILSIY